MNILYTVNEAFVPQLAASVASVCENSSPDDAIHFFVFCDKVSQTSKETLRSFLNKYCVEIDFIDIDGFMDAGCIDFDTQGWNEIVLSRLLLARFLGSDIQRVLYLDADTMVRGSLKELWGATRISRIYTVGNHHSEASGAKTAAISSSACRPSPALNTPKNRTSGTL